MWGMTFLTLHSVSLLLRSVGLLTASLTALMLWKKSTSGPGWPSLRLHGKRERRFQNRLTTNLFGWSAVMFLVSFGMSFQLIVDEFQQQEIVTLRDVHVLDRSGQQNFTMDVEDPDTHRRNTFGATICPNFVPTPEIQAGVTLTLLKYEVDQHDHCYQLGKDNLGYTLRRDHENKPILTTFAR